MPCQKVILVTPVALSSALASGASCAPPPESELSEDLPPQPAATRASTASRDAAPAVRHCRTDLMTTNLSQRIAPAVSPRTMKRWPNTTMARVGRMDSVTPARISPGSAASTSLSWLMPICKVRRDAESPISNGQKNWFHADRNTYSPTAISAGLFSGSRIRRRNRQCPQPSIVAASRSSTGNCRNDCRSRNTPNALARNGSTRAIMVPAYDAVSRSPPIDQLVIVREVGSTVDPHGTISVARKRLNRTVRPHIRMKTNAYAASTLVISCAVVMIDVCRTEFRYCCPSGVPDDVAPL